MMRIPMSKTAKAMPMTPSMIRDQSPEDALASVRMAAINEGIAMAPEDVAAALAKWIAEHDAQLIELLIGTIPPLRRSEVAAISVDELQKAADRRRVGL